MPLFGKRIIFLAALALLAALACPVAALADGVPIVKISDVGAKVTLKDGSVWRIDDPDEQQLVYENWLPAQTVVVKMQNGWKLWNYNTAQTVSGHREKKAQTRKPAKGEPTAWPRLPAAQPAAPPAGWEKRLDAIDQRLISVEKRLQRLEMGLR